MILNILSFLFIIILCIIIFILIINLKTKNNLIKAAHLKSGIINYYLINLLENNRKIFEMLNINDGIEKTNHLIESINKGALDKETADNYNSFLFISLNDYLINIKKNYESGNKYEFEEKIFKDFIFYKPAFKNLIFSIIKNISQTTKPISDELYLINSNIQEFKKEINQFEDEIIEKRTMNSIINLETNLVDEQKKLSEYIKSIYNVFGKNMNELNNIINIIYEKSQSIKEISEKVNILSINTSIEAARAGELGKGFKVIANEIKKLSEYSRKLVNDINQTVSESKIIFNKISSDFKEKENVLIEKINEQKDAFIGSYGRLINYFKQFENVYNGITKFMEGMNFSVLKISPVIQLHEITVQEMENLNNVIVDLMNNNIENIKTKIKNSPSITEEICKIITMEIRNKLTTSRELDALNETLNEFNLKDKIDLKRENKEIDFF